MGSIWMVQLYVTMLIALAKTMPPPPSLQEPATTTARSQRQIGQQIKVLTKQLMDLNVTSTDVILDTRTPPRVKQQYKRENVADVVENSHAGIAIPIDEEEAVMLEEEKKLHFYKIDRPTTDSGLSTWILLSGHTSSPLSSSSSSTTKTVKKPSTVVNNQNMTIVVTDANKMKPLFKKKLTPSTSTSTTTTTTTTTTRQASTTTAPKTFTTRKTPTTTTAKKVTVANSNPKPSPKPEKPAPIKLTKIKASLLNNTTLTKKKQTTTTTARPTTTSKSQKSTTEKSVELIKVSDSNTQLQSSELPLEAKDDGEIDLDEGAGGTTTANPKKRRPANSTNGGKRKKNKNRRKRPTADKTNAESSDGESHTKIGTKEKPIGTQIYNYLSREVMPTVGVGLVGLMVTAGLASYFLYPFGALRRSYDVDRKDKENYFYRHNEYTGGMTEEEAIGKVIAGMPTFGDRPSNAPKVAQSNAINTNVRYRQSPQNAVTAPITYHDQYPSTNNLYANHHHHRNDETNDEVIVQNMYVPQDAASYNNHYTKDMMNDSKDKFVVGNVPKEYLEEATPVAVPEHGPRNMKLTRRRKRASDYGENEIFSNEIMTSSQDDDTTTKRYFYTADNTKQAQETTFYTTENAEKETESNQTESVTDATEMGNKTVKTTTTEYYNVTTPAIKQHQTFFKAFHDILQLKIKLGLEFLQNTTQALSRYIYQIQKRVAEKRYRK